MKKKRLGEILLEAGVITRQQLEEALEDQKHYGGRLGTILLERRFITEKNFFQALTGQLGIPAIDFTKSTIPENVIRILPQELAEKHAVFPVAVKRSPGGNIMVLAMGDPTNMEIQDEVRFTTKCKVEPVLALDNTIRYVIRDYYYNCNGRGSYRLKMDTELGAGAADMPAPSDEGSAGEDLIEHYSRGTEVSEPSMMTPPQEETNNGNSSEKPQLNRELRALLKLLAKKGLITPREYLEAFKESK